MVIRIGLVHATINSVRPIVEVFKKDHPNVELLNFMDEGLLLALNEQGGVNPKIVQRLSDLVQKAADSNVDGILLTCSSFSPTTPLIQNQFSIPVLSVDGAMLDLAVTKATRIGVIATVIAAGPTTKGMLEDAAQRMGKSIEVNVEIVPSAFDALQRGDTAEHDALIKERAEKLARNVDIIVLAQLSMARATDALLDLGVPILNSTTTSSSSIIHEVMQRKKL